MGFVGRKNGWIFALAAVGWSCTAPRPAPNIADPDPQVKIAGIKEAAAKRDRAAVPALVDELNSDDPAVRFYAQQALEEITGETFGYQFYLDEEERKPSLARWRQWLTQQSTAPAMQTTQR
jgi:hypothetical protein